MTHNVILKYCGVDELLKKKDELRILSFQFIAEQVYHTYANTGYE